MKNIKLIDQYVTLINPSPREVVYKKLEESGRICYQSGESKDPEKFLRAIIKRGHESVLEHDIITFEFVTSRAITHELVRHRLSSYSQESQRYVSYDNDEPTLFIKPVFFNEDENKEVYDLFVKTCEESATAYTKLMEMGCKAQEAREVLNNACKTQIRCTMNIRTLRNFLRLRCDKAAHPCMRHLALSMLFELKYLYPVLFEDIPYDEKFYEENKHKLSFICNNTSDERLKLYDKMTDATIDMLNNLGKRYFNLYPVRNKEEEIVVVHRPINKPPFLVISNPDENAGIKFDEKFMLTTHRSKEKYTHIYIHEYDPDEYCRFSMNNVPGSFCVSSSLLYRLYKDAFKGVEKDIDYRTVLCAVIEAVTTSMPTSNDVTEFGEKILRHDYLMHVHNTIINRYINPKR